MASLKSKEDEAESSTVIRVLPSSKISGCVSAALKALEAQRSEKNNASGESVVIIGKEETISKAVTILEIVKRKSSSEVIEEINLTESKADGTLGKCAQIRIALTCKD